MKRLLLLGAMVCALVWMIACKGKATEETATDTATIADTIPTGFNPDMVPQYPETEDVHLDGKQTEYVLIFRSNSCLDRMLRDIGDDSSLLEGLYTAWDDLGFYVNECSTRLEAMGVTYHHTTADKKIFCADGSVYTPQDSCACGVLIVKPDCKPEFVELMDFIYGPAAQYGYDSVWDELERLTLKIGHGTMPTPQEWAYLFEHIDRFDGYLAEGFGYA